MMLSLSIIIIVAFGLDLIFGDPLWLPHPVRWIGKLIIKTETWIYPKRESARIHFFAGMILSLFVVGVSVFLAMSVLYYTKIMHNWFYNIAAISLCFYALATRSLLFEANRIYGFLVEMDLHSARHALSGIVGRDTAYLKESEIARATIETLAENLVDGVISPLFWICMGGPAAGIGFKAVSTLDSMIGYRNKRYRYFGTFAARLDDICNFIPARITALLLIPLVGILMNKNVYLILKKVWRDRMAHPSPNSAHGEVAVAATLGIVLGGKSHYNGVVSNKPLLNSEGRIPQKEDVLWAIRVILFTSFLGCTCFVTLLWLWGRW
jgi:adenosylcobinamide-phosphate synthase